ncbi:family 43 glycosylhydrolase [Zobellia russellii]|uniref:family 43 glycosylhydrolase n=1 Tax=Zobellia russellii TaxID=248907 RepID=UPI0037DDD812
MKTNTFQLLVICFLLFHMGLRAQENILVPQQANEYVRIYMPDGDYFFAPDTPNLKEGKWYNEWVPNDHTFVKGNDGKWHIFGITHPLVETIPLNKGIHEGEHGSFHAVSEATDFKETVKEHHYNDLPKILTPKDRPGEIAANHAPYIVKKDGLFQMVYGHSPMRMAVSDNLYDWKPKGELFSDPDGARDPNLLLYKGTYYLTYCSIKSVRMVSSKDLVNWSEPKTILKTNKFDPESPSLLFHNNTFYLFVCAWEDDWDGKDIQGAYTHKAYVYNSNDLNDFGEDQEKEIAMLDAHAPEIFQGEDGQWYISSIEWPYRGVSIDKLEWVKQM